MITVRPTNFADIPTLSALHRELHALHVDHEPHLFCFPPEPEWDAWFEERTDAILSAPAEALLLAEMDGNPVGFVHLLLRNPPPLPIFTPRLFCSVEEIGVAATCQHCGTGQALMRAAEQWARDHGASTLELSVHDFNAQAISFYQKLGFQFSTHRMTRQMV
ncbi:MAG: GNAT family N-acetyltransferase [Anaerolineaceae bacterium]|nr:GNAT family N-acetyltransferase [Anaerolineaceae bacterium]